MLEDAINNHAAAIRELAAAILARATTPAAAPLETKPTPTTAREAIDQATEAARKSAADKKAKAEADAAAEKQAEEDAAAEALVGGGEESAPVLDYSKDVEHKFKAFLKEKGREAGLALLKKYGAASGSQVPQAKLTDFLADIEAA